MTQRRRRKRFAVPGAMTQVGLAWYGREDWGRLREVADDRDKLDDTYEDWERQALKLIHRLEALGQRVRKVPIDIEDLVAWCAQRKCRIDMASRSEYVSSLLSQGKADGKALS